MIQEENAMGLKSRTSRASWISVRMLIFIQAQGPCAGAQMSQTCHMYAKISTLLMVLLSVIHDECKVFVVH